MGYFFETEQLVLQAFAPEHLADFHAYLNHPDLAGLRYIPGKFPGDLPLSKSQAEDILKTWSQAEKQFHLAIILREKNTLIGHVNAFWRWDTHCPNSDLVIAPDYQRQGYGSQVLTLVLDYFFNNTPAHNIASGTPGWNRPALDFAARHGFTRTGGFRRVGRRDDVSYDWLGMDILRPEWLARSQKGGA